MLKLLIVAAAIAIALVVLVRLLEPRLAFFPTAGEQQTPADAGIPYQASTVETVDGERLRGWVLRHPQPQGAVLYFHGNGGNLSVWLPILSGVYRRGLTVAAIDYRGYGASSGRPSEAGLYRDVDAAIEWASTLAGAGVPLIYWGRSLGTTMAAYAASRRRPDGLILEAGFPNVATVLRSSPPLAFLGLFSSYRFPTLSYAARVRGPKLVIHGDGDQVIPFAAGRALYDGLPEPKRFLPIPGGDHNDFTPPDADRYWREVLDFVSSVARPAGDEPAKAR